MNYWSFQIRKQREKQLVASLPQQYLESYVLKQDVPSIELYRACVVVFDNMVESKQSLVEPLF